MQLAAPTNWDSSLIENMKNTYVGEIYGALPITATGTGRAVAGIPMVSKKEIEEHVGLAHSHSLKFSYLLNAPSLGVNVNAFRGDMDFVREIGADSVTIANHFLIDLALREYSDIPVHVSVIAGVEDVDKAKLYEDMGVGSICLNQHTVNRDPETINSIVEATDCDIRLYANVSCLANCSLRDQHYGYLGSVSAGGKSANADNYTLWCMGEYHLKPGELLKSPFIRPEAIDLYNELGIKTFKLSDRRESTAAITEVINAYSYEEFHGNLFDFLFRDGRKWTNAVMQDVGLKPVINIDNDVLTELDFDNNVLHLEGAELDAFYEKAMKEAVTGVDSDEEKEFFEKMMKVN